MHDPGDRLDIHLVAERTDDLAAAYGRGGVVGDAGGEGFGVRYQHAPAVVGANLGGAQLDALHAAFCLADDDLVAQFERAQGQDQQAADEVGQDVLQREPQRETGQTQARGKGAGLHPEGARRDDQAE